jgi:hypothetical protein
VKDRLEEDTDPLRLARFIVATLEGATTMARMKRDVSLMHGVATTSSGSLPATCDAASRSSCDTQSHREIPMATMAAGLGVFGRG